MTKHRFQAATASVPVNGDQNEPAATGSQETEVIALSSDDQDSDAGRSPTERAEVASPETSGSGRVTRARTRAMLGSVKTEPETPAEEAPPRP